MNIDPTADAGAAAAPDPVSDVSLSHSVTDSERAALADTGAVDAAADVHIDAPPTPAAAAAPAPEAAAVADAGAAAADAAAAQPAAAAAAAPAGPALAEIPPPPKDFAAELTAIETKLSEQRAAWDSGTLDDDEFKQAERDLRAAERALTLEQAKYEGQKTSIETHNALLAKQHEAAAAEAFTAASEAWMKQHADFVANPLRYEAMQQMVNRIDTETGGKLSPAELLDRAGKVVFEAYNYTPKAQPAAARPAAAAIAARQPDMTTVPRTLGQAPTGGVDAQSSAFSHLEGASVQDMEQAVAKMTDAQREAWLREVDAPLD